MGPPFQTNLRWGHRFLPASLTLPLYLQDGQSSAHSIPVRFEMAPVVKKPGQKASEADRQEYRRLKKEKSLSVQFVAMTRALRQRLDLTNQPSLVANPRQSIISILDGISATHRMSVATQVLAVGSACQRLRSKMPSNSICVISQNGPNRDKAIAAKQDQMPKTVYDGCQYFNPYVATPARPERPSR
jgi:hypothetical protein